MLTELLTWWARQMTDLLPRRWGAGARFADAVVLRPVEGGGVLSAALRRRGTETALGRIEPGGAVLRRLRGRRGLPAILALPDGALLQQQASLPMAAERDLGAVLGHEMDRLTPFKGADLFWTWRIEGRNRVTDRLLVRLLLVPRAAAAASIAALGAAGLVPVAIEVATPGGVEHLPMSAPGNGPGAGPGARPWGRSGVRVASAACGVLAVAVCAVPVVRQERAIGRTEKEIAELEPRVAAVDALRRRLASNAAGADLFAAEHSRVGSPLQALSAVTAALPDDTFLTSLAMRGRAVSLSGQSAAAVKLIGLLTDSPDLKDPAFDAPVTRTGGKLDVFSIRVVLAP